MSKNIYTVIMAGGVGSRFWPQSRQSLPKQFIDILGIGKSLLQMTWERAMQHSAASNILILTNEKYKNLIASQLTHCEKNNILVEPSRNNTAPCIAYAAFKLYQQNKDAVMIILPSDHLILKEDIYNRKIDESLAFTHQHSALITLGIQPLNPNTGYGYIHFEENENDVKKVISFKEKPNKAMAESYLASGDYLWNAGIFIWKAKDVIDAFEKYGPVLYTLFNKGNEVYNTSDELNFIKENYPKSPNISIDYAIMEKADNVYTIPVDMGWNDLGTWASLWNVKNKDEENNVLLNKENILLSNTHNSIISANKEKLLVIDGLEDYIVVDKPDVLLIYPKTKEQDIKNIMQTLEQRNANKYL